MKKKVLMLVLACSFLLTACNPLSADVEDGQVQTEVVADEEFSENSTEGIVGTDSSEKPAEEGASENASEGAGENNAGEKETESVVEEPSEENSSENNSEENVAEIFPAEGEAFREIERNQHIPFGNGKFMEITWDTEKSDDVIIRTGSHEYSLGSVYWGCSNAYIFDNDIYGYYLLMETYSMGVYEYGSVLTFHISEDGNIRLEDSVEHAGIENVEGLDQITLNVLGPRTEEFDYTWVERQYRIENGKLIEGN